ncbi:protein kinase superfamily protein [Actinidia rufa]|uniref:Protein kinase superfamily protein n=1 Tax=Actinidia rufa TaxID=165716 RepID=A0A7J0FD83_9ERIC|nr:protein kinase superfamily protein [Actinidia rufa]
MEVRFGGRERESSFDSKSERHDIEVWSRRTATGSGGRSPDPGALGGGVGGLGGRGERDKEERESQQSQLQLQHHGF